MLMLMWDEDAQHLTKPGRKQKANAMFPQVRVTKGHGEGGD